MMKLLYHIAQDDSRKSAISPFDEAILTVARSGSVCIVSPYIGIGYLERIISLSPEWRLISDVQEWLGSLSTQARPRAWQFIRENLDLVHHCPAVHAKAVISDSLAYMGSANLTQTGILGRTEMGILLSNPKLIAELGTWFECLWTGTSPPVVDETSAYVQWLDEEAAQKLARRQRFALSSSSRKVRAHLVKLEVDAPQPDPVEDAPLNLSQVAQAIVTQDQKRYDSLDAALEDAINKLTALGEFTFGQLVAETRQGFAGSRLREIYYLLIQRCANHVRSIFVETTLNRLILSEGRFSQSTKETLLAALVRFDAFLVVLVGQLNFSKPTELPTEDQLEVKTAINGREQVILISELLYCGFLVLDDRPGELPCYMLDDSFEWERRFRFFEQAHVAWTVKKRKAALADDVAATDGDEIRTDAAYGVLRQSQLPEFDDEGDEANLALTERAGQRALVDPRVRGKLPGSKAERQAGYVDTLLTRLFDMLQAGKVFAAPNSRGIQQAIKATTGNRLEIIEAALNSGVVSIVSRKGSRHKERFVLEINPDLSWETLEQYPQTKMACATLLNAPSDTDRKS